MKHELEKFELETTTIWSFKERENWATHKGDYRAYLFINPKEIKTNI